MVTRNSIPASIPASKVSSFRKNNDLHSYEFLNNSSESFFPKKRTEAETRRYMAKFDELAQNTILQNVLIKFWKILIKTQYRNEHLIENFNK